jgi:predicted dehydrogenase
MVGFTYRRVPALGLAQQLVAEGRLGQLRHVRAQYLQDWIADPSAPMSWRLVKEQAGSGALGDIGAHIVDLTQFVTGDRIASVTAAMRTFVDRRPVAGSRALLGGSSAQNGQGNGQGNGQQDGQPDSQEWGTVTVDDATSFLARFEGGAMGVFEATRFATGRKNAIRVEINGSDGSLAFDFEDMNVLHFHDATEDDRTAGFRRILVTESSHPYVDGWWPPGHLLGYEHGFTHQVVDLVRALAAAEQPTPSFADGLAVQAVLGAVERSAQTGSWQETEVPVGAV